jgi:hypothetical protein
MADLISLMVPFLFMLAIVYGALDVSGVFKNKRVNALIALVFAFFTLTYAPAIEFINQIMPYAIMFFVAFFFLGFIIKAVTKGLKDEKGNKDFTLLIIILGLVLLLFATQGPGFINNFLPGFEEQASNIMVISAIVFIGVIFLAVYKLSIKEKPLEKP